MISISNDIESDLKITGPILLQIVVKKNSVIEVVIVIKLFVTMYNNIL